ncbi:hypothetical protein [Solibacillus isronensis]|uniref:hypothetical protein n=1 Tax=Solibacillus isronensis TaxID=412383 RepID=UPI0009A8F374|nr:hypothetical protein [Solibacillus isronensis]
MTNIKEISKADYLEQHYEHGWDHLAYPMLRLSSVVGITMELGRDFGYGDKIIFGMILDNDYYVAFSMNDEDLTIQSAIVHDEYDNVICRGKVNWLKEDDEPVNMVEKLTGYYNAYAKLYDVAPLQNHGGWLLKDMTVKHTDENMTEIIEHFMIRN